VKQRGFTLLEMLVASTIMAIAVVGILSALSATVRNAARLTDYDRAVMLSRSKLDELLLDAHFPRDVPVTGQFDRALMGGLEGGWRAQLTRMETAPKIIAGDQALDRMQFEIWWISNGHRRTFAVNGYRTTQIQPEDVPE